MLQFFFGSDILEVGKSDLLAKERLQTQGPQVECVEKMESWKLGKLGGIWRNVKGRGSFLGRRCEDVRM